MGNEVHHNREQLRLFSMMAFAIILLAVAIMALLLVPGAMGGTIVGDQPPASGDWVITKDTVVTDHTVSILGNVIIEADLTLRGSSILIEGAADGSVGINVTSGGTLTANDTSIVSSNGSPYYFRVYDEMDLTRVTIRNVHGGVLVSTSETVNIDRVRILDFGGSGLVLEDASGTTVKDVSFHADGYLSGHYVSLATDGSTPYVEWEYDHPGIIVIRGGSPSIVGVDISINGSFALDLDYRKNNVGGGLGLDLDWALIYVDSKDAVAIKDVTVRHSDIYLTVNARVTDLATSIFALDTNSGVDVVLFHNYRDASIVGIEMDGVAYNQLLMNVTGVPWGMVDPTWNGWDVRAVHAFITESFATPGPHEFDLEVRDISQPETPILYHHMELSYTGTSSPTFDSEVLVDNVSTNLVDLPIIFEMITTFALEKTVIAKVTVSNSTFDWLATSAITVDYRPGPNIRDRTGIKLHATTTIEDCVFTRCRPGTHGIVNVPMRTAEPNLDNNTFTVKGCKFSQNTGTLLNINGSVTIARDRLVIDDNEFTNNTASIDQRTLSLRMRTIVEFTNNTFSFNKCTSGIYIEDLGATENGRFPCKLVIANNSFVGNIDNPYETEPGVIINVRWGGELIVRDNTITDTGPVFLILNETAAGSVGSTLDFYRNQVHRNDHAVLLFTNNARDHRDLVAFIRNNTVWDNKGALVDFVGGSEIFPYDYDATYLFLDNDVRRAGSTVFANYGNITVSGNTFVDCVGWVLRLDHLRQERPYLAGNTFTRCGDGIFISAKLNVPAPVLLWMDNNTIDTSGTAIYMYQMEVTLRTTTISSSADRAVVADLSFVDAYDCDFEMDDCEVIVDGYIRMWYWVEAWVHWASKAGVASSNPVVDGNITFIDQAGHGSLTVYSDEEGHVEAAEVLAWHIEHSTAPVAKNPYTIMVSISSFSTSTTMNITHSYKDTGALNLVLWDPVDPLVSIDSPEHMSAHNTVHLNISGFATDTGSGVHTLTIRIVGGASVNVTPDEEGSYLIELKNPPEGMLEVRATITDKGLNTMTAWITVEIDRTPPKLVVTHPSGDLHTNVTEVTIRGEVEAGSLLIINMMEYGTTSGIIDATLPLNEGSNYFGLTATDRAGNTATVVVWVHRDTLPPELQLFGPTDGTSTNASDVMVWGSATDYDAVTLTIHRRFTDIIDRPIYPDEFDQFEVWAELEEGTNEIVVTALDLAGNTVTLRRTVTLDTVPPLLELVSPEDNTLLNQYQVTVVFTVSEDADQVYVNDKRVLGTGEMDTVVILVEGDNPITLRAFDTLWNQVNITITVRVDTVAPVLELTAPAVSTFKTNERVIEVRGRAYDPDGTGSPIDRDGITIDGQVADTFTFGGSFIHNLVLDEDGVHIVEVVARDRAGNMARTSFTVDLRTVGPVMSLFFDPTGERLDPGTVLLIQGSATGMPLNVTIIHSFNGNHTEHSFLMEQGTFVHELDLVDGMNTITVRSVDTYGNWNVTDPYAVDVTEKPVEPTSDPIMIYLVIALVAAAVATAVIYVIVRRSQ